MAGTTKVPWSVTLRRPRSVLVVVVGAGGTGARFGAVVPKMLRRGDGLVFIDHDVVEEKNLHRQHFVARDVGRTKAEVLGRRIAPEAARVGFHVEAVSEKWNTALVDRLVVDASNRAGQTDLAWAGTREDRYPLGVVVVGCVDNKAVRAEIEPWLLAQAAPALWLDAGNEMRAGQVVMSTRNWPLWEVRDNGFQVVATSRESATEKATYHQSWVFAVPGLRDLFPTLLHPEEAPVAGAACEDVPDLQSVTANNLAAAYLGTMLSWVLDEIPFTSAGVAFSQLGTVQPFPITTVERTSRRWTAKL